MASETDEVRILTPAVPGSPSEWEGDQMNPGQLRKLVRTEVFRQAGSFLIHRAKPTRMDLMAQARGNSDPLVTGALANAYNAGYADGLEDLIKLAYPDEKPMSPYDPDAEIEPFEHIGPPDWRTEALSEEQEPT